MQKLCGNNNVYTIELSRTQEIINLKTHNQALKYYIHVILSYILLYYQKMLKSKDPRIFNYSIV